MYLYWAHRCFALQSIHEHTYSNVSFSCSSPSTGYCALADLQLTSHLLDFRSSRLHLKGAWSRMSPMTRRSNRANTTNKTRPHSQTKQITAVPALCPGCCRHHNPDKRKHPSSNRTAASASLPHLCMLSSLVQCTPNPKEQWHQGYKNQNYFTVNFPGKKMTSENTNNFFQLFKSANKKKHAQQSSFSNPSKHRATKT